MTTSEGALGVQKSFEDGGCGLTGLDAGADLHGVSFRVLTSEEKNVSGTANAEGEIFDWLGGSTTFVAGDSEDERSRLQR